MSKKEYEQVRADIEGMNVILEFPAGPELTEDGKNGGSESEDRGRIKREIREILTGVLLEKMNPLF